MGETAVVSSDAQVFESEQMAAGAVEEFAEGLESEVADTCMSEMLGEFVVVTCAAVGLAASLG